MIRSCIRTWHPVPKMCRCVFSSPNLTEPYSMSLLGKLNPFRSDDDKEPQLAYIDADTAKQIDEKLMGPEGAFSLDQLMELAGLSVAQAVATLYPLGPRLDLDKNGVKQKRDNERVLVLCGPGNQGGDGLVAARHLYHFGYSPSIFYPKESKAEIFPRLKKQCENLELPLIAPPSSSQSSFPMAADAQINAFKRALSNCDVVLDCIFGFSFKPPTRQPFDTVLRELKDKSKPIVSVDIPSGWDVNEGNVNDTFVPSALISLTAPKLGVREFAASGGTHYLGGRFVPIEIEHEYGLNLPNYPGTAQCVDITAFRRKQPRMSSKMTKDIKI